MRVNSGLPPYGLSILGGEATVEELAFAYQRQPYAQRLPPRFVVSLNNS